MAGILPTQLRCEYRVNPLGIDEKAPRLSWVLESKERAQTQSGYRILVGRTEEDLEAEANLIWDSGRVESSRSVGVVYEGEPLRSGVRCVWKVRVWDGKGEASAYSEPAFFELGLLDISDWQGAWISLGTGPPIEAQPPAGDEYDDVGDSLAPSPYLRNEFDLRSSVRRARLYATARGVYEVYLNGVRVGDDLLAPGWTDYRKRVQYQTYDVTDLIAEGRNAIGGILGDGWFAGFVGFDPKHRGAHYGARPQLLLQLNIEYQDGSRDSVATDASWRFSTGAILFSDFLVGESYDARKEIQRWAEPGSDGAGWYPVGVEDLADVRLVAQPDEGVRIMEVVEPKTVTESKSGAYVYDMGQNMVGWVRLRVQGAAGTEVTLRHAEALNPDGTIYTSNLRFARATDRYVLKGGEEEVYEPRFTFHGFRYVEIAGYPGEPPLAAITGRVLRSATPVTGSFDCSNPMVNKLQSNILWGQRGNFLSVPTDCPQRDERLGWTADAQIFAGTASFNMDVARFFEKWMGDVRDAQSPAGAFPDVAPLIHPTLFELTQGAPAWGDAGVIVPWTVYRLYEDTRIVEDSYDAMTRWMVYLHEGNPELVRKTRLGNNYGDWLAPKDDVTPRDLLATAYWAYDARLMAEMAAAIGRHADAVKYRELFEGISRAFVQTYLASDGRLEGDTQTGYVLALHMGLLPEELRPAAAEHLVRAIERDGGHLSTGFVGVGYLCPALTQAGRIDVAYRLLLNETFPSWGYTIKNGATTIWERWDGWTAENGFQSPNMNSFNHYSLGSVGEWLYRDVAGLDLDGGTPGYARIVIRPRLGGGLTYARGELDSVRGRIVSAWSVEGDRFRLQVSIPPNTTGTVYVPVAEGAGVSEGGAPATEAKGVEFLKVDGGEAVLSVGSGRYEFVSRVAPA
ncbi:MAG: glycoside hydrolase family 78 protein [Actinomycetota bacterium]|nr:glycoside hydrolase family 78 protein [Actinomycetota bacterium]